MLQIALGLLALSAFAGFLALCLEAADAYFADYGECRVNINRGEKELVAEGGGNLLSVLTDQRIFIPSACGGRGSCGLCKIKVLEGAGPLLPTETPYLDPEEIANNVRLSCQVKLRNDVKIEIPPELFLIKEYKVRVAGIRDLTPDTKEFRFQLLDPGAISFKAGQYLQVNIPEYEGCDEPVYRAYSIASPESKPEEVTLVVTKVPEGIATTYLHDLLEEGSEITLNGPYGDFYLGESDRDVFMIATGSGLAPIMSLLYKIADEGIQRKTTVIFGDRTRNDLFYIEELEELGQRIPSLEIITTLSRPVEEDRWNGRKGRVTDVLKDRLESGENTEVYVCGNPAMVEAVEKLALESGVPRDRIFYDKYA
ncbi:MAG: 2Fe-2S iron-sulfur cluster binding domain-containing protein [Deltaproteobacteria bacterium]|nr:2Fe-2S iron-sulfur cluster binding domain-containing protein [Deltaproteobacteria bacterium]